MPPRLLLQEHFPKHRHVLPVHAVQHHIQHLLYSASWSRPGDVAVAQLRAARRRAAVKSSCAPFVVAALLTLLSLFLFTCRPRQILFMLLLQLRKMLLVALTFLVRLLFPFLPPRRRRRRQPLSFSVLFIEIFSSDAVSPVPEVLLVIVDR